MKTRHNHARSFFALALILFFVAACSSGGGGDDGGGTTPPPDVTIGEIVDAVRKIVGKELPVITDPSRIRPAKSEVMRLLSDNSKAKREIGWEPQVSIEEGLAKTTDWIREHLKMYQPNRYVR